MRTPVFCPETNWIFKYFYHEKYFWLRVQENQFKLANMVASGSQFSWPCKALGGCVYGGYSAWQIIGMTIILDFYYQLSVVLTIPHLWELDASMMEMMFYTSADNVEFSLMSATQLELIILNQWIINQSLLVKISWTISLWFSLTTLFETYWLYFEVQLIQNFSSCLLKIAFSHIWLDSEWLGK